MKFFNSLSIEICITGIQHYGYVFTDTDTSKQMKFTRDYKNKYDKNAIKVWLDDQHIGYIKKNEAQILAPILKTNTFYVRKWGCVSGTTGYMVIHCVIKEQK